METQVVARFLTKLALLTGLLWPTGAHAEPAVRVEGTKLIAEDPSTGEVAWTIDNLGIKLEEGKPQHPIQGPVQVGDRWYYSAEGDLLELDVERGVIVARTQYPTMITAIEGGDVLRVTTEPDGSAAAGLTFVHRGGPRAIRGLWSSSILVLFRPARKARKILAQRKGWNTPDATEERAALARDLARAEVRDETNAFLPLRRGMLLQMDGEQEAADEAFDRAIAIETPWTDDLELCGLLYRADRPGRAAKVCDRVVPKLKAEGTRPEAMFSLVALAGTAQSLREEIEQAVDAGDLERVDRLVGHLYSVFPLVEASPIVWRTLSGWYSDQDRETLARKWGRRADEATASASTRTMLGGARIVDLMLLLIAALTLALPAMGFIFGVRSGLRNSDLEGQRRWRPRPKLTEGLAALLVLGGITGATWVAGKHVEMIGSFAQMPIALLSEGYASPEVTQWLEERLPSEARDELLEYAKHEQARYVAGEPLTREPPEPSAFLRVIEHDANEIVTAKLIEGQLDLFEQTSPLGTPEVVTPPVLPFGLGSVLAFLFLMFAGNAAAHVNPNLARKFTWLIPGGPRKAAFAGPLILVAFLAGFLWVFTPVGTILQEIAVPAFGKYFGLSALDAPSPAVPGAETETIILPALLIAATLLHGLLVALQWRGDRDRA